MRWVSGVRAYLRKVYPIVLLVSGTFDRTKKAVRLRKVYPIFLLVSVSIEKTAVRLRKVYPIILLVSGTFDRIQKFAVQLRKCYLTIPLSYWFRGLSI